MKKVVHVAVGILINKHGEVLIAKRPDNLHQGGLWEFPGGKIEPDESALVALKREFKEEVAIDIQEAEPYMEIHHDYDDKAVFLDVWLSRHFTGVAIGLEGQQVLWVSQAMLPEYEFPDANRSIVDKIMSF